MINTMIKEMHYIVRCQLSIISEWSELYWSMMSSIASSGSVSSPTTDSLSESSSSSDASSSLSSSGLSSSSSISKSSWKCQGLDHITFYFFFTSKRQVSCASHGFSASESSILSVRSSSLSLLSGVAWRSPHQRLSTVPVYSGHCTCVLYSTICQR